MDQTVDATAGVTIRIFGSTSLDQDAEPISIGGPRQRRLLALLAIRAGSVVSIDWLAEHLWADADRPAEPAPALRTYVSRLRQSFPEEVRAWLQTEPSGYQVAAPLDALEHRRFGALRSRAKDARDAEDPQTALTLLDEALALWRGDPFRELEDLDWARADTEQLELDRLEMLEERWEAALALGRHTQITGELAAFTAEHTLRERATRQHALALHRSGRTTEALRVVADFRRRVAEQSGLDPSPEFVEFEAAILRGDPALAVDKVGRPLRGYRLLEEIGAGAFSIVWRGVQPSIDREVAIKQIRSELASQPDFIRRFEAEAHLVARIEHPHIVPLIDYWRDPDSAYLVMRWLRGGTLERRLDDGLLTIEATLALAHQVGGALAAAHDHGIVHRDVKTANVLFDEHDNAYLADFGIALEATRSSGIEAALSPGSPAYASPEQIRRERLGPQADVFSLAVVLYECLTGSLPFSSSSSVDELIERQLHTPFPSVAELRPDVPPSISAAIERATSKDPRERFDSIAAFLEALDRNRADRGTTTVEDIENPYRGLLAFDDGDEGAFFGRDAVVAEMLDRLAGTSLTSRCLVLVGASGSGKSSVVRAGLIPALRAGGVAGSADWFVTTMLPGGDPFESLEAALLRIAVNPPPTLLEQLRDGERGILRSVRRCIPGDGETVVLVIDQFEEIFTSDNADNAREFLAALATAVGDPQSPLRLVATLRADYYHHPLDHLTFAAVLKESALNLTPLAPHELEQAIVEPARQVGVRFEPGLVPRIAAETIGQPSPLPLLQYMLSELFEQRSGGELTVAAYEEIGGLSGALAARADQIYDGCSPQEQAATRRVFGRLTNAGQEAADLRQRVPVADFGEDQAVTAVLDRFGAARLLSFDRDLHTREPTVEVAHEALLREWPRLVSWLAEDRELLRSTEAVASAASIWDDGGREDTDLYRGGRLETADELARTTPERLRPLDMEFIDASRLTAEAQQARDQRAVRRLRRLAVGFGAALVVALIAGALAVRQQQRADDEAEIAVAALIEAEEQGALALESADEAAQQRDLALAATDEAELATLLSRSAALADDDPTVATLLALEAHRREQNPETEQALFSALTSTPAAYRVATFAPLSTASCPLGQIESSGASEFLNIDGILLRRDLLNGAVTESGPSSQECVSWVGDQALDRRVEWSFDRTTLWFGPYEGPPDAVQRFESPMDLAKTSFRSTNVLTFIQFEDGRPRLHLLDDRTGEPIREPIAGGASYIGALDVSLDGSLIAWATHTEGRSAGDGFLVIIDGRTGRVLFDLDTAEAVARVAFDPGAPELVAVLVDGSLMTVDLVREEVAFDVPTTLPPRTTELDVRADGAIVAVSAGQVALLNRETGRVTNQIDLQSVENSRYRPDGTLLTVRSDDQIEVLSFEGNALVDRVWDFPAESRGISDGFATGVGANGPVVLDLGTGGQRAVNPEFPSEGSDLHRLFGDATGYVAVGDREIARWEIDQLVESVDLEGDFRGCHCEGDLWPVASERLDGTMKVDLVQTRRGQMGSLFEVETPNPVIGGAATPNGGMWLIDGSGELRTYDAAGALISQLQTELSATALAGMRRGDYDTTGNRSAHQYQADAAAPGGIVLIDHVAGTIETIVEGQYESVEFAHDGRVLVLVHLDGTIWLWDVEQRRSIGAAWNGTSAVTGAAVWSDETTPTIWAHVDNQVVQLPVAAEGWAARACEIVGRDLTQEEWDHWVPGNHTRQSACR